MRTPLITLMLLLGVLAAACSDGDATGTDGASDAAVASDAATAPDAAEATEATADDQPTEPSGTEGSEAGAGGDEALIEVLAASQEATIAAGSAAVTLTQQIGEQTVGGEGAFTFGGEEPAAGRLTLEQPLPDGTVGEVESIITGTEIYLRFPEGTLPTPTPWVLIDLTDPAFGGSEALGELASDPTQSLVYLRAATDVQEVGEEEIAGVATTHYTYTVDLVTAVEVTEDPALAEFLEQTRTQLGSDEIPAEVWIDEEGLVRQQSSSAEVVGGDGTPIQTVSTITYTEYGVEVDVAPPPAEEVTDLADLAGTQPAPGATPGAPGADPAAPGAPGADPATTPGAAEGARPTEAVPTPSE